MKKPTRIIKNMSMLVLSMIIDTIGAIVILGFITRYLGTKLYGEYAFVMNIIYVCIPLINFGLSGVVVREIAKVKGNADKIIAVVFILKTIFIVISIAIISGLVLWLDAYSMQRTAIYLAMLAGFTFSYIITCSDLFIAFEKMWYVTVVTAINQIASITLIILAVHFDLGFVALFVSTTTANILSLLISVSIVLKFFVIPRIGRSTVALLKYFLKESYPIALSLIIFEILFRLDIFIITMFRDFNEVAIFNAPQRLILRLSIVSVAFVNAMHPTYSRLAKSSPDNLLYLYRESFKALFAFIFPVAIFTTLFAEQIVVLFFGTEFSGASYPFIFLVWMLLFMFMDILFGHILISLGRQALILKGHVLCFVVNIIFAFILIPRYGSIGAGCAKVISFGTLFVLSYYFVSQSLGTIPLHNIIWKPVIASSVMVTSLLLLKNLNNILLLSAIGFSFYLGTLIVLRIFTFNDIKHLREVLKQ